MIASDQTALQVIEAATNTQDNVAGPGALGVPIFGARNDSKAVTTAADQRYSWLAIDSAGALFLAADKFEDTPHVTGAAGLFMMGVRKDTPASTAGTDGDYTSPIFGPEGRQYVRSVTDRAEQASGRTYWHGEFVTAAGTIAIPVGKTAYLTGYHFSGRNAGNTATDVALAGFGGPGLLWHIESAIIVLPTSFAGQSPKEALSCPGAPYQLGVSAGAGTLGITTTGGTAVWELSVWGYYE